MINLHDLKYYSNLLRKLVASKFVPGNVCNYFNFPKMSEYISLRLPAD